MGATAKLASAAMGGLAIGLCLTLIHFISIPVTNTSVNPARSTSQALIATIFGDGVTVPLEQLWLFWAAPVAGAIIGALFYRVFLDSNSDLDDGIVRTDASPATSRESMTDAVHAS